MQFEFIRQSRIKALPPKIQLVLANVRSTVLLYFYDQAYTAALPSGLLLAVNLQCPISPENDALITQEMASSSRAAAAITAH